MKKFFKSFLVIMVAVCVAMPLVACKKKVSKTTTDQSKVKVVNGVNTNGGMTAVYDGYLYFINGTKTNDGKSLSGNTRSAICRVKYDAETGEASGDIEIVVDDLVGYKYGSLHFFGDYMYYATPCDRKNSSAEVLYNKTCFKRYDLVNKKSYTIYTTQLDSDSESVEYAYYVAEDSLNLLVFEASNYTLKSFKIDKKVKENYTISDVTDCFFSENYGVSTTSANFDANSFVYYTLEHGLYDGTQDGVKVYKTSPVKNNSVLLSNDHNVNFVAIRAGKLVYSSDDKLFACSITSKTTDTLAFDDEHCIYHSIPEFAIYLENYRLEKTTGNNAKLVRAEGEIAVLAFDDEEKTFSIGQWRSSSSLPHDFICLGLTTIEDTISDFGFVGTVVLEEKEDVESDTTTGSSEGSGASDPSGEGSSEGAGASDPSGEGTSEGGTEAGESDEDDTTTQVTVSYLYVIYQNSEKLYKLKVGKVKDDSSIEIDMVKFSDSITLTSSTVSESVGLMTPEIIGNQLFILSENDDEVNYILQVDLTPTKNVSTSSTFMAIEEAEETEED